jgi:hypothetical protein
MPRGFGHIYAGSLAPRFCTSPKAHGSRSPFDMDGLSSPPTLSSDVQRALQQAVGQVNNAFNSHQVTDQSKPTRRKRPREKATAEDEEVVIQKKTKRRIADDVHASPQEAPSNTMVDQSGARSKKRRKASSKQRTQVPTDVSDVNELTVSSSDIASQSQTPTAFLNAVVAAASTTAGSPSDFSHACFDTPPSSSYPYSTSASNLPSNAAAFQPPVPFSTVAVPDLEYASNEDILRALQDLDVTKIATVLKTLGEAAAAANIPLTSLSSIIPQRPPATSPSSSTPSDLIVASERPTRRVSQLHRHRPNVNSRQEPLAHSDHAELLSTKWLSANKLAELAKTQGEY